MSLRLTITSYHKLTPGQNPEMELDRGELKIGRGPENDWVLPDPERLVSGQHCVIQFRDGTYYLTDTSTNGVLLVNSGVRMRRGNSEPLSDGELLRLGEYDILVRISDSLAAATASTGLPAADPFVGFDALMSRQAAALPELPAAAIPAVAPVIPADPISAHFQGRSSEDTKPDLFDFLAAPAVPPPSQSDHVPAERHDFRPPEPQMAKSGLAIPADWDPLADSTTPSAAEPAAAAEPSTPAPQTPPEITLPPLAVVPTSAPVSTPTPTAAPTPKPTRSNAGTDPLEAFLRGAGLAQLGVDRADAEAQMEAIGRSYRHMVEGLVEVLRARASLKGEFRMAQTMIRPVENNPLKFAPNADEAMLLLLRHGNKAFMPPDQAISESFDDLKAHQLAVMAGVQAAIKHLLKRFEPAVLEARMSKPSGLSGLLPGGRQAQNWELFTELYASISREVEEDFQDLFGREFSRAYEEHSLKLRKH